MKILVPINFCDSSLNGIEYAIMVAKMGGHSITTLHVATPQKAHSTKLAHRMQEIQIQEDVDAHSRDLEVFLKKLSNPEFEFEEHLVRRGVVAKRTLIESMNDLTQTSASQEFTFRGQIPILHTK